ncbi:MAG: hypothetical protein WKF68_06735 [Daejeonella sp.]
MKPNLSIQIKAVFLLIVFSLSTLVSFACATGLNMGYNEDHHKTRDIPSAPEHSAITDHHSKNAHHKHARVNTGGSSSHKKDIGHHVSRSDNTKESTPDDCCRDEAAKFEKSDKLSPQTFNYNLQAQSTTLAVKPYFHLDAITAFLHTPNSRYFIRIHHPPIADTRIAIQSFLI